MAKENRPRASNTYSETDNSGCFSLSTFKRSATLKNSSTQVNTPTQNLTQTVRSPIFEPKTRLGQGSSNTVYSITPDPADPIDRPLSSAICHPTALALRIQQDCVLRALVSMNKEAGILQTLHTSRFSTFFNTPYDGHMYYNPQENVVFSYHKKARGSLTSALTDPEQKKMNYARQICASVAHLHTLGFIHRDIKPENILVMSDSTIQLCDFGLATRIRSSDRSLFASTNSLTTVHKAAGSDPLEDQEDSEELLSCIGTPTYFAPEVIECDHSEKTDIYSTTSVR